MDWHKAEEERPEDGRIILVMRAQHTKLDKDRYCVCKAGRVLLSVPFYPFDKRDQIPWVLIDKWTYIY